MRNWLEWLDEFYHRHPWPGGGLFICDVYEKRVTGLPWSQLLRERFGAIRRSGKL